jgi:YD repeat-containing protein
MLKAKLHWLLALMALTAALFSCKNRGKKDTPPGDLLVRHVNVWEGDSLTTTYDYDEHGRLVRWHETLASSVLGDGTVHMLRDSAGLLRQAIYVTRRSDITLDSLVYQVHYDTAGRPAYSKLVRNNSGSEAYNRDSTAYSYNAQNRIIAAEEFTFSQEHAAYVPLSKTEYTYDALGNVLVEKAFVYGLTGNQLQYILAQEYDTTHGYPIYMGNEGVVLQLPASRNVVTNIIRTNRGAESSDTLAFSFSFDRKGRPLSYRVYQKNEIVSWGRSYYR